ncbi:hypothetical protein ACRS5S_26600 [Nocardia asiatica]|nr:hypothetical protein [Nocardia asiatica]
MPSEVIYNRIAMLRAERGISRRELAQALGSPRLGSSAGTA